MLRSPLIGLLLENERGWIKTNEMPPDDFYLGVVGEHVHGHTRQKSRSKV